MQLEGPLATYQRSAPSIDNSDPFDVKSPATVNPFQIRRTARLNWRTAEGLVLVGTCLEPWFVAGDVVWFDRTIEPKDGDLVAALLWYESDAGGERAAVQRVTVKQLRVAGRRKYLIAGDGFLHADAAPVLGPIVAWHRPGWWRRPPVRKLHFSLPVMGRD